jgi:heme exporter protein A
MSAAAQPAIAVDGLTRRYERRQALRKVSFALPSGAIHGLAGDNGAGKSTLLKVVAGLLRPTEGMVALHGLPVTSPLAPDLTRRVGYLGHQIFIYAELTGLENLLFFLGLHGFEQSEARARELLATVGLTAAADQLVRTYSRGMAQRLALGRLLAQEADLWLLDEPTTGLDRAGVDLLRGLLADLAARGGTALVASHELDRFSGLIASTISLRSGRLAGVA